MKNLVQLNTLSTCNGCNIPGFFCYTPGGADYYTCPLCESYDFLHSTSIPKYCDFFDDALSSETPDNRVDLSYCSSCRIMFEVGCTHSIRGCTSDAYNGHLISKWQDATTREIYTGMPQFDSTDEWFVRATDVHIMDMVCINTMSNIGYCRRAPYPQRKDSVGCFLSRTYPVEALSLSPPPVLDASTQLVVRSPFSQDATETTETSLESATAYPFREKFSEYQLSCIVGNTRAYIYVLEYRLALYNGLCACGGRCSDTVHPPRYVLCIDDDPYRGPAFDH